ncbi:hypothetical protein [Microcystis aeruginosa]|uniref:hypothetical protein n=1 Tax=Microcystis aeruginosa TaxID=1126 RepID=UPI001C12B147|nr:hypothetical protein [Microcystis aeruginosa]
MSFQWTVVISEQLSIDYLYLFSPHPTPQTPHPTPHTLHPTPYTLHPTPHYVQGD